MPFHVEIRQSIRRAWAFNLSPERLRADRRRAVAARPAGGPRAIASGFPRTAPCGSSRARSSRRPISPTEAAGRTPSAPRRTSPPTVLIEAETQATSVAVLAETPTGHGTVAPLVEQLEVQTVEWAALRARLLAATTVADAGPTPQLGDIVVAILVVERADPSPEWLFDAGLALGALGGRAIVAQLGDEPAPAALRDLGVDPPRSRGAGFASRARRAPARRLPRLAVGAASVGWVAASAARQRRLGEGDGGATRDREHRAGRRLDRVLGARAELEAPVGRPVARPDDQQVDRARARLRRRSRRGRSPGCALSPRRRRRRRSSTPIFATRTDGARAQVGGRDRDRGRAAAEQALAEVPGITEPAAVRYSDPNTTTSACSRAASSLRPSPVEAWTTTWRGVSGAPIERAPWARSSSACFCSRASRSRASATAGGERTRATARRPRRPGAARARARRGRCRCRRRKR